jgi:hypothetical protein
MGIYDLASFCRFKLLIPPLAGLNMSHYDIS